MKIICIVGVIVLYFSVPGLPAHASGCNCSPYLLCPTGTEDTGYCRAKYRACLIREKRRRKDNKDKRRKWRIRVDNNGGEDGYKKDKSTD